MSKYDWTKDYKAMPPVGDDKAYSWNGYRWVFDADFQADTDAGMTAASIAD